MFNSFYFYIIKNVLSCYILSLYRVIKLICMINFTTKDVYDSIPTIVTTFVAIIAKISIFIFLLELVHYTSKSFDMDFSWTMSLLFSSLLSLVIGTIVGLTQTRIKRLYAFSTISHVGFILLALSIHSVESTQAFLFYLMQYSISNLNAFMLIITIGYSLYCYVYKLNDSSSKISSNEDKHEVKEDIQDKDNLQDINNSPALRSGKPLFRELWPLYTFIFIVWLTLRVKWSNSGNILKLLIPSPPWKWIDGCPNKPRKVISQKMRENKMDNRGSKSMPLKFKPNLSRTLHNTAANIKLNNGKNLEGSLLNPWFITGFTDGEGSFMLSFLKNPSTKSGWQIQSIFQIALHEKDVELLELIQAYFGGVGRIARHGKNSYSYRVRSLDENVNKILPHFDKYPLISQKYADYLLWKDTVLMMKRGEHLTVEGFQTILNMRASLNLGCSEDLKLAFPKTTPVKKAEVVNQKIPHPEWLAGFTSGEGNFSIKATKIQSKLGFKISVRFRLSQHSRDKELLSSLISYFECGVLVKDSRGPAVEYSVYKFSDVYVKILPFFSEHKVRGVKAWDFQDWCRALEIIQAKGHLTQEGLDEILKIKAKMNKGRSE